MAEKEAPSWIKDTINAVLSGGQVRFDELYRMLKHIADANQKTMPTEQSFRLVANYDPNRFQNLIHDAIDLIKIEYGITMLFSKDDKFIKTV